LAKFITRQSNATHNIEEMGNPRDEWRQWRIGANQVEVLVNFISQLPLGKANSLASVSHPRHFPGPVRQLALEQFNREGRKCPGVPNLGRKKHRLSEGDTIEFDHLLPHSHGGSSSEINIQVLCVDCNRAKAATTSTIPSFSHDRESLSESREFEYKFREPFDQWAQTNLGHVRDQAV